MSDAFAGLDARGSKGSRSRCLLLTHGPDDFVARRLTELTDGIAGVDPGRHNWTPRGLHDRAEAELGKTPPFLSKENRTAVSRWWLAVRPETARTPNWDIVSQATIAGRQGLILVEAKAHAGELRAEERRKPLRADASAESLTNHQGIGACIDQANAGLRLATKVPWLLSRDVCYQMSNRFAWSWKMTQVDVPVVLVYLGFLNATEMPEPITDHRAWEQQVTSHGMAIVPTAVWGSTFSVNGVRLTALVRSLEVPLRSPDGGAEA